MEIVDLSNNDMIPQLVQKCNMNFKKLAFSVDQLIKSQGRESDANARAMIDTAVQMLVNETIPAEVTNQIADADIPSTVSTAVSDAITAADIPGQVSAEIAAQITTETTTTVTDFFMADACTVTAGSATRWGKVALIRMSYRLNSALTVPSNGDITDVTLGTLKPGWVPVDMTDVILDQTRIVIGDVDASGVVKARSANSRGTSYTIDVNAVLYASMTLMLA